MFEKQGKLCWDFGKFSSSLSFMSLFLKHVFLLEKLCFIWAQLIYAKFKFLWFRLVGDHFVMVSYASHVPNIGAWHTNQNLKSLITTYLYLLSLTTTTTIDHCSSLSLFIDHCTLSNIVVNHCPQLSIIVDYCLPLSIPSSLIIAYHHPS